MVHLILDVTWLKTLRNGSAKSESLLPTRMQSNTVADYLLMYSQASKNADAVLAIIAS